MNTFSKFLTVLSLFFSGTLLRAQDISVAIRAISGTPPQAIGSPAETSIWNAGDPEAYFVVRVCNNSPSVTLANYRIRPLLSGPNGPIEISSTASDHKFFDPDTGLEVPFTVLTVTNTNTFRFSNATYGMPPLSCVDVYIKFNPIIPNPTPTNYLATIGMQWSNGTAPGTANGPQTSGNNTNNDNGTLAFRINADVIAVDDIEMVSPLSTLTGNVLTNDTYGVTVASASQGATSIPLGTPTSLPEGTITINADGSYTFVPLPTFLGNVPPINYVAENINASSSDDANLLIDVATGLPVEFKGMQVTCINNGRNAELTWQTASELNSEKFVIERSFNGNTWSVLGEVQAAGTTNQQTNYTFVDNQTRSTRIAYYRLSQFDFDGAKTMFPVVSSSCDMPSEAKLYPNPATDVTYVEIVHSKNEKVTIEVRSTLGSLISSETHNLIDGYNLISLDVKELHSGSYFVVIKDENNETNVLRFVKQ